MIEDLEKIKEKMKGSRPNVTVHFIFHPEGMLNDEADWNLLYSDCC